jgi:hypothetical protein
MLDTAMTADTAAAKAGIQLDVVSNLDKVATMPNSTVIRRQQIATILSKSVFDFADGEDSTAGSTSDSSSSVSDAMLSKTAQVIASIVAGAVDADSELTITTAQALLESSSSVLRTTAGNNDDRATTSSGSRNSERQAIASAVEAVALATIDSSPSTSIVTRSIAVTRATVASENYVGAGVSPSSVELSAYVPSVGQGANDEDPRGLARPSTVVISAGLVQGDDTPGGGGSVNAFVFQYSEATNPFSPQALSDVVVVRVDSGIKTNGSSTIMGDVGVEMSPRSTNSSLEDECTAVFDVESSGTVGLESTLTNACGKWNGSSFESTSECQLGKAEMNATDGTWSLRCECAVGKAEIEDNVIMALVSYTFDRFGRVFEPGRTGKVSVVPVVLTCTPIVLILVSLALLGVKHLCARSRGTDAAPPQQREQRQPEGIEMMNNPLPARQSHVQQHQSPNQKTMMVSNSSFVAKRRGGNRDDEVTGGRDGIRGDTSASSAATVAAAGAGTPPPRRRRARNSFDTSTDGGETKGFEVRNPLNTATEEQREAFSLTPKRHDSVGLRRRFERQRATRNIDDNHNVGTRIMRHLFLVETDGVEGDETGDAAADDSSDHAFCLRRPWQRRVWGALKNSHNFLSIFMAERKPGMGVSQRLVLFLGTLQSQMMGVTLMYYIQQCYTYTSIFEEGGMDLSRVLAGRFAMLVLTSLFCVPVDVIVHSAFSVNQFRLRVDSEGKNGSCCLAVCPQRRHGCIKSKTCTRIRAFGFTMPWLIVTAQVAVCSAVTIMLTAADHNGEGAAQGAEQVPCHCRISHNSKQSGNWLLMVVFQMFFWLCISRPLTIAVGMLVGRTAKAWFAKNKGKMKIDVKGTMARFQRRSVTSKEQSWSETEMVGAVTGVDQGVGGGGGTNGEDDTCIAVSAPRTDSINLGDDDYEPRSYATSTGGSVEKSGNIADDDDDGGIGGTLNDRSERMVEMPGTKSNLAAVTVPPSSVESGLSKAETTDDDGNGAGGTADIVPERRPASVRRSVSRRKMRFGSTSTKKSFLVESSNVESNSAAKRKTRGKKKTFDAGTSNVVVHGRKSSASQSTAASTEYENPILHKREQVERKRMESLQKKSESYQIFAGVEGGGSVGLSANPIHVAAAGKVESRQQETETFDVFVADPEEGSRVVSRGNPMHDSIATFPASEGASVVGTGGTGTQEGNATKVIRGTRTKSIVL